MTGSLETTNALILWLVIVTALMPVMLIGATVYAYVALRRLTERVDRELAPAVQRASAVLDDAEHLTRILRRRLDQVDDTVTTLQHSGRRLTGRLANTVGVVGEAVAHFLGARAAGRS